MKYKFALITLVILVALAVGSYAFVNSDSIEKATLNTQGQVEINQGNGFIAAQDGMQVKEDDIIRTNDGTAELILYESVFIVVEENSELKVTSLSKKNVELEQGYGSSWTKFANVLGMEGIKMKTPSAVATVRGTTFGTENDSIMVSEGKVEVVINGETFILTDGKKVHNVNGTFVEDDMTKEQLAKASQMLSIHLDAMKEVRNDAIDTQHKKYAFMIDPQLEKNEITMDEAYEMLEVVDQTGKDVDEIMQKSPVKTKPIKRIGALTKEIQEMHKIQRQLNDE